MPKQIISFVCQECGYDSPAFLGKCPECGSWNSFKEFSVASKSATNTPRSMMRAMSLEAKPEPLSKIQQNPKVRLTTDFSEMDTVLGGGIVVGSATLVAGDPGIGKSTLLLQLCINLAKRAKKILYVSAEESREQVAMRAKRIALADNALVAENLLLLSLTDTDAIVSAIENANPDFVVIDSVQTVQSENAGGLSGSVGQVRYGAQQFIRLAKEKNIAIMIVGHVTKEGMVAGPMVLSHMVDTVLFLEGEKFTKTRILRSLKNRFGPVDEVGVFLMDGQGLTEVKNPEQIFLSSTVSQQTPGSVLVIVMEGTRPFLVEIQSLAVYSKYPMPKRVANGIDQKRLELLLAVLQKHVRLPVENHDIFVNIAGGIKVTDPAVDLGVCLAVYSSLKNIPLPKTVGIAEIGLLGELRKVPYIEKRVKEAQKMGYTTILTAEKFTTLQQALAFFGESPKEKQWKQKDERHFALDDEA